VLVDEFGVGNVFEACACYNLTVRCCPLRHLIHTGLYNSQVPCISSTWWFRKFWLGRLQYVKSVANWRYSFHSSYLHISWVVIRRGRCSFDTWADHPCPPMDLKNSSKVVLSHLDTPWTDHYYFPDIPVAPDSIIDSYHAGFSIPLYTLHSATNRDSTAHDEKRSGWSEWLIFLWWVPFVNRSHTSFE